MAESALKNMNRNEMLEMLVDQEKEITWLKAELESSQKQLEAAKQETETVKADLERELANTREALKVCQDRLNDKEIKIAEAGSLAEASLSLNDVFGAADRAAKQLLDELDRRLKAQEVERVQVLNDAEAEAQIIIEDAENVKQKKMQEADEYWDRLSDKMEEFYQSHQGLKSLLEERQK